MSGDNPSIRYKIRGVDEMYALAERVANGLRRGDVLLLEGDLGSGKTTFVQGLARTLDVKDKVTSPTYVIEAEYDTDGRRGIRRLIHIDLYRLSEKEAMAHELFDEKARNGVTVIEWADRWGENIPARSRKIKFAHGATEEERIVTLEGA